MFDDIVHLMSKQSVHIFSEQTLDTLTVELNEKTKLSDIKATISSLINVPLQAQNILLANGVPAPENIGQHLIESGSRNPEVDPNMVFVFDHNAKDTKCKELYMLLALPDKVQATLMNPNEPMQHDEVHSTWKQFVFVVNQTINQYKLWCKSIKILGQSCNHLYVQLQDKYPNFLFNYGQVISSFSTLTKHIQHNLDHLNSNNEPYRKSRLTMSSPLMVNMQKCETFIENQVCNNLLQTLQAIVPKIYKTDESIQCLTSADVDTALAGINQEICSSFGDKSKSSKDEHVVQELVRLLVDCFQTIEKARSQIHTLFMVLTNFRSTIVSCQDQMESLEHEFLNWKEQLDENHTELWKLMDDLGSRKSSVSSLINSFNNGQLDINSNTDSPLANDDNSLGNYLGLLHNKLDEWNKFRFSLYKIEFNDLFS